MNDSTPRRRRRRRGGAGRKPTAETTAETTPAPSKDKPKEGRRQRPTQQKRPGRSARRDNPPKVEKISPDEMFAEMVRGFPPEYSKLPEFVKQCRRLRDKHDLYSEDEFFYFIATSIETLAEDKFDELFISKYAEPLRAIRIQAGLAEEEFWKPGDPAVPDEYRQTLEEFRIQKIEILSKMFENFGETSIGASILEDYPSYIERRERGKREFYSRHKFEAVRMEPSEMNLEGWVESPEPDAEEIYPSEEE